MAQHIGVIMADQDLAMQTEDKEMNCAPCKLSHTLPHSVDLNQQKLSQQHED